MRVIISADAVSGNTLACRSRRNLGAPDVESRVLGEFLDLLADEDVVLRLVRVEELNLNVEVLLLQQRLRHLHARGVHELRQRRAIALGWATDEMTRDGGAPASLA